MKTTTRICNWCEEEKSMDAYDNITPTTWRKTCRKCRNKKNLGNWVKKNKEKRREYNREYMKKKYRNCPHYKRYSRILTKIRYKIFHDAEFREEFEKKFTGEMTWKNYGEYWEIDHIIPVLKLVRMGHHSDEWINHIDNVRPLEIQKNRERND